MSNETNIHEHVGELLSGYIDGELTQQDQQRVRLHCENCADCRRGLEELRTLRETMGKSNLSKVPQNIWRETMDDTAVKATRGIGWVLFIGGLLLVAGYFVFTIIPEMSLLQALIGQGKFSEALEMIEAAADAPVDDELQLRPALAVAAGDDDHLATLAVHAVDPLLLRLPLARQVVRDHGHAVQRLQPEQRTQVGDFVGRVQLEFLESGQAGQRANVLDALRPIEI